MLDFIEGNCVFLSEQVKQRMDSAQKAIDTQTQTVENLQAKLKSQHPRLLSWAETYDGVGTDRRFNMQLVELFDLLKDIPNIESTDLSCCDPNKDGYSLLRIQMRGDIKYSSELGVILPDTTHDEVYVSMLRLANQRNDDLVLFPEYCISYTVLEKIISQEVPWPASHKLWILPCQGIPISKFDELICTWKKHDDICLIDNAWTDWKVDRKQFVTAFFYCFLIYDIQKEKPKLCLIPQLKTCSMGDSTCLCEGSGMTTGNIVYLLNHCLVTLLCADSLNNNITWQKFQSHGITEGLILLHPQLNAHPRDSVFLRLQREMCDHGQSGTYITCNWAEGTRLSHLPGSGREQETDIVKESWSCIYRKHQDDISEQWKRNVQHWKENLTYDLIEFLIEQQRTEIWYSDFYMHALAVYMPNLRPHVHGNTQVQHILARKQYTYEQDSKEWTPVNDLPAPMREQVCKAGVWEEALRLYNKGKKRQLAGNNSTTTADTSENPL